ncbi:hypothetical protein DMUE_5257 [Dictyocoela muelleri]|nr:hypothetical protein DMUE_5257 [Dictyocoela muelleri]
MREILTEHKWIREPRIAVQVDETVRLNRRRRITNPYNDPDTLNTLCFVEGIEGNTARQDVFITIVSDRNINTLSHVIEGYIRVGSVLTTDVLPSYPQTADNLNLLHHVVNHSTGFVNEESRHTNKIVEIWAQLKPKMREGHGCIRDNVKILINFFYFRKKLPNQKSQDIDVAFDLLINN